MPVVYPNQFLGLPPCRIEEADAVVLPLPFERTVSYGDGTWRAPRAIIDASCQVELFDEETLIDFEAGPMIHTATAILDDRDTDVENYLGAVRDQAAQLRGKFVLSLGGEHTVTYGLARGLTENPANLTIVQLDAHADLVDVLDGKKWSHGTVMRRLREEKVRLVQVGTRSLSRAEYDFAVRDEGITVFFAHEMGEKWGELRETLRQLKGDVYLSIDVDGFDPAVVPNTGAPQPNGLTWNQAIEIIQQISLSEGSRFLGADVVEYVASPHPPGCDIVVAKLAAKILAYWFAAKDKRPRPSTP